MSLNDFALNDFAFSLRLCGLGIFAFKRLSSFGCGPAALRLLR
jgi:hypothetical protein